jgi:hypothetical protein
VDHERALQQIVVAAIGAGPDHGLVERDAIARDLPAGNALPGLNGLAIMGATSPSANVSSIA